MDRSASWSSTRFNSRPLLLIYLSTTWFYFVQETNICNFADDNTLYVCGENLNKVISNLQSDLQFVLSWFHKYMLAANTEKF